MQHSIVTPFFRSNWFYAIGGEQETPAGVTFQQPDEPTWKRDQPGKPMEAVVFVKCSKVMDRSIENCGKCV